MGWAVKNAYLHSLSRLWPGLRCKPQRSAYVYIRLAVRFLSALHHSIFKQPLKLGFFKCFRCYYLTEMTFGE